MKQQLIKHENNSQELSVFSNTEIFEHSQRIAKMLCSSDIVPTAYKGNVANTLVAMEMAKRLSDSPLMIMQNMNVIHGKPSWGSSYIIGKINTCGRFSPIKWRLTGTGDNRTCIAYATELASREIVEGPPISIEMAKKEGWYTKSGSKWPTMPDLMLQYRAAAFFGRLYVPDLLMGMQTTEELYDVGGRVEVLSPGAVPMHDAIAELNSQASGEKTQTFFTTAEETKPEPAIELNKPEPNPSQGSAVDQVQTNDSDLI